MFAKSIKKNGHFRAGQHIPHEGVDLGEVSAEKLAVLKSDASIVLSETAFDSAPAATAPEATVPEATAPAATVPEATVPEATVPEATAPAATAPAATAPEATVPEATVPEAKAPAAKAVNKTKGK